MATCPDRVPRSAVPDWQRMNETRVAVEQTRLERQACFRLNQEASGLAHQHCWLSLGPEANVQGRLQDSGYKTGKDERTDENGTEQNRIE